MPVSSHDPGRIGRLTPAWRRLLAVASALALLAAVLTVTATEQPTTMMTLPAATADPTGPTGGPGGDAGGANGGQFQPPGMPNAHGGDNGGNYPAPPQGDGIDINNPSAAPEYSQAPQYTGTAPTGQQPVHGTQPPDYDAPIQQPSATAVQEPPSQENRAPSQQSPETGTQAPTSAPPSSAEPTPTNPPNNDSDQAQQRDDYRCLNTPSVIQFTSMKGPLRIGLTDGGQCENCDTEKPRENPNNCSNSYVSGIGIRPATPGAEGGMESIMVYPTQKARTDGLGSGMAILAADAPSELKEFPADIAQGAESAYSMWGDILCHAQASQIMSPSDPSKSISDRIAQNPNSVFQQFICHFYGAQKKFWDGPGGYAKPSWNLEWARAAEGTTNFVFSVHPCN